jgi:YHS domain-containing protein
MQKINRLFVILASAAVLIMMMGTSALAKTKLTQVPNQKVCMVTNMLFPRDQIPVSHGGKTYYGCCENCKQTLSQDASARTALDPVSKKPVDKATAVIGAFQDGTVLYFESKASLKKYQSQLK